MKAAGLPSTSLSNSGAQPSKPPALTDVYFPEDCEISGSDDADTDDGLPSIKMILARSSIKAPQMSECFGPSFYSLPSSARLYGIHLVQLQALTL